MSITSTLSLAGEALKAQQLGLQTTGHNLANVATPGYSRQSVDFITAPPAFESGVLLGQGVKVDGVQRIVDQFYESQLLSLTTNVGYANAQSQALTSVQDAFPTSGGVNDALSAFFGALSDLANNPSGVAERVSVVGKANALGQSLAQTRQIVASEQQNLDQNLTGAVQKVNTLLSQIAGLNQQILSSQGQGQSPNNDALDQRQTLLQQVAKLTGATARQDADGAVTVSVGGLLLVGGNRFASLASTNVNAAGLHTVTYQSPGGGVSLDATALFSQGTIGGILNARDNQVQSMLDHLDQLAKTLVDQVNAQHALGFDLTGAAGSNFFAPIATTDGAAGNVQVNGAIAADPRGIAAAAAADTVPGDNRNALALVNLQSTTFPALGGLTLQDSFLSLAGDVGSQVQNAQTQSDFQQQLLTQAQARRDSVSGVNTDEEMIKLIEFQRAFESSALLIRTADQMYQSLVDMVQS